MSIEHSFDIPFIAAHALREKQIQQNYRPYVAVHKWFARRPGSLFRGLLLAEFASGDQGAARAIDRKARLEPLKPMVRKGGVNVTRVDAIVATACELLAEGAPSETPPEVLHRLAKADTQSGLVSLRAAADIGIPLRLTAL
jgi:adenine-specific DNA methylase